MSPRNAGEALIRRLKILGVDYFFASPGTEFVSVIRGFRELPGDSVPTPILVPHEFQAVSMAYGYYLATAKPQAVMTHATVGAANALIGLIGASRMNVPLIFISGMTAQSEHSSLGHRDKLIHWSQDSKDQGAMFREYVKWEVVVSDPAGINDVLDRAYAIATSAPCGPVAIKISRDVLLSEKLGPGENSPAVFSRSPAAPDEEAMRQILSWLSDAQRPLVITNRLGADPKATARLIEFSSKHSVGVMTPEDFYMSFPSDHPNHLGSYNGDTLGEADFVLVLDTETPWYPLGKGPDLKARVVHVGQDPLFENIPLRGHRGDLFLQSSASLFLNCILKTEPKASTIAGRNEWIRKYKKQSQAISKNAPLNAATTSAVLSEFLNAETTLINELGLAPDHLHLNQPGTYFRSGSASPLGWGVGCAVGLSLADRQKTVIAAIGDGVFYLSPILSAMALSTQLGAPFVMLILNNGGMNSIERTVRDFYPEVGKGLPLTQFAGVEFENVATLVNGLGLRAETSDELREVLGKAIAFCREHRRPAVINVVYGST